ncbi:50S ribosomal protein L25/general stress protein Ctc [Tenacibaculum dicentrarchi]|uniref:50S ribosomal protein L25/general stress protein Ctc n=1 Tax=Tenacibaculum dicentrarchi TaxID=669041 RepID=UPI000C5E1155|nr:50S ribosomal protein L25/general stress protein Ctc [Tenacibaculum dicentrarchi]MCD8407189.1 50S ribosomal protein L25/general stress protein Ctc [Tenacibaculum dicentrarchi]MCD8413837.1 50S ribosomal protein L25/general stress protein Ctc [Tenacibaculum dicentrarchi]MCD8419525.1 50S ribosomal protein L25/general stress protein Ctc [Tenacibaculum dicentrarchi]MCD8424540.1 50S ribosomal protein L25/general stress protein Ctc [Tenacibaculum dicentrarchi]
MKSITINGSKRESVGKRATKDLRNAGKVPCVLYGGEELVHFSAAEKLFKPLVFTPDVFTATIELDGAKYSAVLQDIQFHPVTDAILHVDFYQIFDDKELTMDIPVRLVGTAKGIMLGGALRHNLRKLKVKGLPGNLPDFIEADITELAIGNKLYVTELRNDKYALLHPDNTVVAQVRMSRNAAKAAAAEEEA